MHLNHLYTLIVRPENVFEIQIDRKLVRSGNLLTAFGMLDPPKETDDPSDTKPADWDEEEIDDPTATKLGDWDEDEPTFVRDSAKLSPPARWLPNEPKFLFDQATPNSESRIFRGVAAREFGGDYWSGI
jgi:calnexin